MTVTDFLWQGSPPPNVSTTTTSTPTLPDWYQTYLQGLLAKSNSIAGADYQTFGGPRVAGLTPDQEAAFAKTRATVGQGGAMVGQGADAARSALGSQSANALAPYAAQAGGLSAFSASQPYISKAAGMSGTDAGGGLIRSGANMSSVNAANTYTGQAVAADQVGAARPYVDAAMRANAAGEAQPYLTAGLGQSGARAAQPYLAQGAEAFPTEAARYMNPYNDQVTTRIGELSARNLKENILPGINTQFISAGQFGGSRQGDITARAIRDANESALGQQASVLQQGYQQAGQQFTADQSRALQAGQTAGALTQGDATNWLRAGETTGALTTSDAARQLSAGQTMGQFTGQQGDRALGAATLTGSLTNQDAARQMQAGQSLAEITNQDALRQLQAGQLAGSQTAADRSAMIDLGKTSADAANLDASRAITAGSTLGGLGQIAQNTGIRDAAALEGIGSQQQTQNQRNLDTAYADFLQQRGYPAEQAQFMSQIVRGLPAPTSTTTTSNGPASTYQASPLAQIAGGLGTAASLKSVLGLARGGRVKRPAARGGLNAMRGRAA